MAAWTAEFRPYNRIDCGTSAQRSTSDTEAYRQKSTPYHIPTTQELLKKARGVCRGAVALRPLCGFPQLPKAKNQALCQETQNNPQNQSHNK